MVETGICWFSFENFFVYDEYKNVSMLKSRDRMTANAKPNTCVL